MGDEDKTLDAEEESAPEEAVETPEAVVTMDSEEGAEEPEATEDDAPKLRLAEREDKSDEDLLGVPEPDDLLGDEASLGALDAAPRKKGLAGLFGGAGAAEAGEAEDDAPKWAMSAARPRPQGSGILVVNRVLAAAVVLILVFGVLDLFATIRQTPAGFTVLDAPAPVSDVVSGDDTGSSGELPVLANLLESFAKRPIVRNLDRGGGGQTTVQVVQTRTKVPDWKVQVQKLDLIGLSDAPNGEMEAIVAEREAGRMHFLRVGQEMVLGESRFLVARIATDHVAFEKDGDEVIVK